MKSAFLLALLASWSLASARVFSGTPALAVAACLINSPWTALAVPVWTPSFSRLGPRRANSTTTAAAGTHTVVSGDTLNAIAAAAGVTTKKLKDANAGVVPTKLRVGQVLNLPASASSNTTSNSTGGRSSAATGASTSQIAPAATLSSTTNVSDVGERSVIGRSAASTGTTLQNSTSTCGSNQHHSHNGTAANAQGQNGTSGAGHHTHNGTSTTNRAHNSTSSGTGSGTGSGGCTGHHHNGTTTGTKKAVSSSIPATATASALGVAVTSSGPTGHSKARALNGFLALVR